jgi:hypothetical protein
LGIWAVIRLSLRPRATIIRSEKQAFRERDIRALFCAAAGLLQAQVVPLDRFFKFFECRASSQESVESYGNRIGLPCRMDRETLLET